MATNASRPPAEQRLQNEPAVSPATVTSAPATLTPQTSSVKLVLNVDRLSHAVDPAGDTFHEADEGDREEMSAVAGLMESLRAAR